MTVTVHHDCSNLNAPYLPLQEPFTSQYRLSLLKEDDLPSIVKILSNPSVSDFLANVPQPYRIENAREWYKSQPCNSEYRDLAAKTDENKKELLLARFPFSVIREVNTGELVGNFSIRRNGWEWMEGIDPIGRQRLKTENESKVAGDETIKYSIGVSHVCSGLLYRDGILTGPTSTA